MLQPFIENLVSWNRFSRALVFLAVFSVTACGGGGGGGGGGGAPTNVTVNPGGGGSALTVSWVAPNPLGSDGNPLVIAAFNVYRGTTAGNLTLLGTVTVNNNPPLFPGETTFTDNTATSGTTFFYAVSAVATNGSEGPRSATVSGVAP